MVKFNKKDKQSGNSTACWIVSITSGTWKMHSKCLLLQIDCLTNAQRKWMKTEERNCLYCVCSIYPIFECQQQLFITIYPCCLSLSVSSRDKCFGMANNKFYSQKEMKKKIAENRIDKQKIHEIRMSKVWMLKLVGGFFLLI